jgi:hypothetical protein
VVGGTPERTDNLVVGLTDGKNALVVGRPPDGEDEDVPTFSLQPDPLIGQRPIYTDEKDMPSLEQLLRENRIAYAVFERDARRVSYGRVVAASTIGVATSVVGWVLLLDAVAESAVRANPYTALSLALGGIVLLATLLVALYGPARDSPR